MANEKYHVEQFIKAIPDSLGIISAIAKRVGCEWHTAKWWIDHKPTVRKAYDDECENALDMVETRMFQVINRRDGGMIRYYLSTKGKRRGYTERHEITGTDGAEIAIRVVGGVNVEDV